MKTIQGNIQKLHVSLGECRLEVFRNIHNIEGYSYTKLFIRGRSMAVFGSAPDLIPYLQQKSNLSQFLHEFQISSVLCVDSKRYYLYRYITRYLNLLFPGETITAKNLLHFYKTQGLRLILEANGQALHLADFFELQNASEKSGRNPIIELQWNLENGQTLGNALDKIDVPDLVKRGISSRILEEIRDPEVMRFQNKEIFAASFRYFLTKEQLEAFINTLTYYHQNVPGNILVHCAGGLGRTLTHLIGFLMQITRESFDSIFQFVSENYHARIDEVVTYENNLNRIYL